MAVIDEAMRRVVDGQRLGYVATVCPDGTPNLSPKGTILVWDEDHLTFADIRSPGTVANLRHNPAVEINVVNPLTRKGTGSRAPRGSLKRVPTSRPVSPSSASAESPAASATSC